MHPLRPQYFFGPPTLRAALAVFAAGVGVQPLHASLEWETKVLAATVRPVAETLDVAFHYKNTGATSVRIMEIETSCGCTSARPGKKTVTAGAEGEIDVHFQVRDRVGLLEEIITVHTDDPTAPQSELTLRITAPARVETTAQLVTWQRNESPAPKDIFLTAADGIAFKFLDPKSPDERFTIETKTEIPGKRFRLRIQPRSTGAPAQTNFLVMVDTNVGHPQALNFFALVR